MIDAQASSLPVRDPAARDIRGLVVGVVEDLHVKAIARPVDGAHRIDDTLSDVSLVVDRDLDAHDGLLVGDESAPERRWRPDRPERQVEEVGAKDEKDDARHGENDRADETDQLASNRVYGSIVDRT